MTPAKARPRSPTRGKAVRPPRAEGRRGKQKKCEAAVIALTSRPVVTLFGLPVVANPHIAPNVILVHNSTYENLLITLDRESPSPRRRS